jgi:predicted ribosome quality control (RQC) complex YloA/Tae2 family protein
MESKDVPAISLSTESTHIDISPQAKEAKMAAPEPVRRPPSTELRKPAPAPAAAAPQDPRKASEFRRPPTAPVPVVAAPPAAREDEDPEKLLREYADRQKTKMAKLESQLGDLRKTTADRDQLKARVDQLSKELGEAKAKLEAAGKMDAVIKDLQGKLDAAILSNSMLTEEHAKLKAKATEYAAAAHKNEERAAHAEKTLAETIKTATSQQEARKQAEARIAAALQALGGAAPAAPAPRPEPKAEAADAHPAPAGPPPLRLAQPRPGIQRR